MLRLLKPDGPHDDDGEHTDQCPFCKVWLGDLDHEDDGYDDVASAKCPNCEKTIAVVITRTYRLAKFKDKPEG